jgi:hypothetical protein
MPGTELRFLRGTGAPLFCASCGHFWRWWRAGSRWEKQRELLGRAEGRRAKSEGQRAEDTRRTTDHRPITTDLGRRRTPTYRGRIAADIGHADECSRIGVADACLVLFAPLELLVAIPSSSIVRDASKHPSNEQARRVAPGKAARACRNPNWNRRGGRLVGQLAAELEDGLQVAYGPRRAACPLDGGGFVVRFSRFLPPPPPRLGSSPRTFVFLSRLARRPQPRPCTHSGPSIGRTRLLRLSALFL